MGSTITLQLEWLQVDWGQNESFHDHSSLFDPGDLKSATYYYAMAITEEKPAYARSLRNIVKRLELLGYTISTCRKHYEDYVASHEYDFADPEEQSFLSFEQFARILRDEDVTVVPLDGWGHWTLAEFVARSILPPSEFERVRQSIRSSWSSEWAIFDLLDPYVTLRMLAENPSNLGHDVIWRFADVVGGGWVRADELYSPHAPRILLVTEGSSDSAILKESLPLVEPDVVDFFDFVDMTENYPFTGTGNIYRFCQGLVRIRITNRIHVVLDNDVEGLETAERIRKLSPPPNMTLMVLPDLDECRTMKTVGPSGENQEDVNGKAVSIECFLDLNLGSSEPTVRWTSYNDRSETYQGHLVGKERYVRRFFSEIKSNKRYDLSKLALLWGYILKECCRTD